MTTRPESDLQSSLGAGTLDAALARTVLLLRDHIRDEVPGAIIADALASVRVVIGADGANGRSQEAQHAITTTALLAARSGARVAIEVPDTLPLLGPHAPLRGDRFAPSLRDALADLIPGVTDERTNETDFDVVALIGDTRWQGRAERVLRLQCDAWSGAMESRGDGARWISTGSPFGALAAGGLVAGEMFKSAAQRLRAFARDVVEFDALFAPTHSAIVRLAPRDAPPPRRSLGCFDLISAGAIIQSALYALGRIEGVEGDARLVEQERYELSNLNRYALLLASRLNEAKAIDVARWAESGGLGGLRIQATVARYDDRLAAAMSPSSPAVLVGVDDIPTRWVAQAQRPSWLGVGATSHHLSVASYHTDLLGCARCLHPRDDPTTAPIPTAAFISHWAGLWLAAMFARHRSGIPTEVVEQAVFMTPLRAESPVGAWFSPVARRSGCPVCGVAA